MTLCQSLRWKGYREDVREPGRVQEVFAMNMVPYSCVKTCQPFGPDGGPAAPETCGSRRRCFAPLSGVLLS